MTHPDSPRPGQRGISLAPQPRAGAIEETGRRRCGSQARPTGSQEGRQPRRPQASAPAGGLRPPRVLGLGIAVAAVAGGAVVSPGPAVTQGGGLYFLPRSDAVVSVLPPGMSPGESVAAGSLGPQRLRRHLGSAPSRPFLRGPCPPSVLPTAFSVPPACGAPVAPCWAPAAGGARPGLQTRQR